jgi:hypothetical protein
MDAVMVGIDMADALASLPSGVDRDFARELLIVGEIAHVAETFKRKANEGEGNGR